MEKIRFVLSDPKIKIFLAQKKACFFIKKSPCMLNVLTRIEMDFIIYINFTYNTS